MRSIQLRFPVHKAAWRKEDTEYVFAEWNESPTAIVYEAQSPSNKTVFLQPVRLILSHNCIIIPSNLSLVSYFSWLIERVITNS